MTREEALSYLGGEEGSLIEEFEQKLFDFKQYFLTKPIISKLYRAQFGKMAVLEQAGMIFRLENKCEQIDFSLPIFSDELISSFTLFESEKAKVKTRIINCSLVSELNLWAEALLALQESYIRLWPVSSELNLGETVIGKEPDPMDLLNDIKELSGKGINRFNDLTISSCETLVTLLNEWKRLSLLRQKELEWTKTSSIN